MLAIYVVQNTAYSTWPLFQSGNSGVQFVGDWGARAGLDEYREVGCSAADVSLQPVPVGREELASAVASADIFFSPTVTWSSSRTRSSSWDAMITNGKTQ